MLEFKELTLEDRPWAERILKSENSRSADFNFGNMYMWLKKYPQRVARFDERLLIHNCGAVPCFSFPVGSGPVRPALDAIIEYAADFGEEFCMLGLTEEQRAAVEAEFPGKFAFRENRFFADYIYSAEKLATYSGHALHGKRNHCNRFEAEHEWKFVPLTRALIPDCADMLKKWNDENADRLESGIEYEYDAIARGFAAYEQLGLEGGVLIADGEIMGFSVGEMTCGDTLDVHFEKAFADFDGAYSMVCREMARMMLAKHPELKYLNREEDMDNESLRFSKMSYKPEFLLTKYDARCKNGRCGNT